MFFAQGKSITRNPFIICKILLFNDSVSEGFLTGWNQVGAGRIWWRLQWLTAPSTPLLQRGIHSRRTGDHVIVQGNQGLHRWIRQTSTRTPGKFVSMFQCIFNNLRVLRPRRNRQRFLVAPRKSCLYTNYKRENNLRMNNLNKLS